MTLPIGLATGSAPGLLQATKNKNIAHMLPCQAVTHKVDLLHFVPQSSPTTERNSYGSLLVSPSGAL